MKSLSGAARVAACLASFALVGPAILALGAAGPAAAQGGALPKSASAPDRLPDNARPIEAAPETPKATEILSAEESQLLLGAKPLSWKRLADAKERAGRVEIRDEGGLWRISGSQRGALPGTERDSVEIEGVILRILPNMFTIKGEVTLRSAGTMGGAACKQAGTVTFRRHPRDPFWRLLDDENPCDGRRELVEIRMDPPPKRPPPQAAQKPKG